MRRDGHTAASLVLVAFTGLVACKRPPATEPAISASPLATTTAVAGTFVDEAAERGLVFRFQDDTSAAKRIYETLGGGVVLFDADGDSDLDVFLPGGGSAAGTPQATTHQALFRNDGSGRFTAVTADSGLAETAGAYAIGGAAGDVDGDGDLDLYVTCLGPNRLYRNDGSGRFTRVEDAAGAADPAWSAAAAFFDADGDQDLDLYVVNYVRYDPAEELPCTFGGERIYCTPSLFDPAADRFYRNDGGRFVEESAESGLVDPEGKGLAVLATDVDGDADVDVYVANDITPNLLFVNDGRGHFQEEGLVRGVALGRDGQEEASMGVAAADFDRDQRLDLVVTNFSGEVYNLFSQDAGGLFTDVSSYCGLAGPTTTFLGFGAVAADFDLDGWVDLVFANGHINDLADTLVLGETYLQANLLLRNVGEGRFERWSEREGDLVMANLARGLAVGDLDGDGDLDLVASRIRGKAALFLTAGTPTTDWIAVRPLLKTGAPAIGARATLHLETGAPRLAEIAGGGSYASQNEPVLRFGLGDGARPRRLELRWPGGEVQEIVDLPLRQVLDVRPAP